MSTRTQLIESVGFVRSLQRRQGCGGWAEESFFELMPQLFGKCNFGIARETRRWFDTDVVVVRLSPGHAEVPAYRVPAMKYPFKTDHGTPAGRIKRSG